MPEHYDWTPAHLRQLDKTLVDALVAKLKGVALGYGSWLEIEAFAETRTIHDGRRLLALLSFIVNQRETHSAAAAVMSSAIADLEKILPKDG